MAYECDLMYGLFVDVRSKIGECPLGRFSRIYEGGPGAKQVLIGGSFQQMFFERKQWLRKKGQMRNNSVESSSSSLIMCKVL